MYRLTLIFEMKVALWLKKKSSCFRSQSLVHKDRFFFFFFFFLFSTFSDNISIITQIAIMLLSSRYSLTAKEIMQMFTKFNWKGDCATAYNLACHLRVRLSVKWIALHVHVS